MKNKSIYYILILSFLIFKAEMHSQEKIKFEHLTGKDGLPSDAITSICQDTIGFLWLGTYGGLVRYDGNNFRVYQNDPKSSDSISHSFVRCLLIDKSGTLWVGTWGGGLNMYDDKKDAFVSFQHDSKDSNTISNNLINAICQDHNGNIWIATWGGGVNKIDYQALSKLNEAGGNKSKAKIKFIHFQNDSTNQNSLPGDKVNSIYEDKNGTIWIATKFGASKYDVHKNEFVNLRHSSNDSHSLSSNNVTSICEDKEGILWLGTWDDGLNKLDQKSGKVFRYRFNKTKDSGISSDKILKLYKDRSENLWIGTWGGGLMKLVISPGSKSNKTAGEKNKYEFITFSNDPYDPNSISGMSIYSIFEDNTNILWIGTNNSGLEKIDKRGMQFAHAKSDPLNLKKLNEDRVISICVDRSGLIWIGTSTNGINLFDPKKKTITNYLHDTKDPFSISDNQARAIYQDKLGTMWVGTLSGFNKYDQVNNRFIRYYFNPQNPSDTHINSICEDRYGYLWLGSYGSGLIRYDRKKNEFKYYQNNPNDTMSISDNILWAVCEDRKGNLWIGTGNGGLNKYDRQNDNFHRYLNNPNDSKSISSNFVENIFEDSEGVIWLGTGNGINKIVESDDGPSQYSFIAYTTDNGLSSNSISAILEDDKYNLWISSVTGISKFNKKTLKINNYDESNGLQGNAFAQGCASMNKKTGVMYFGGTNGYNYFHPDSIKENLFAPPVVIVDLKIFNKSIPVNKEIDGKVILSSSVITTKEIVLSYKENVLSFSFAALQYNSPKNNSYAYMMEGFDKDWNYQGNRYEVTYTNLNPGEYNFKVKGSNNDGVWNEKGASISVIITPPFWQTLWFRGIFFLIIVGCVYWVYRWHIQSRDLAEQKRLDIALSKERNLLRTLIDNIPDGVYIKDKECRKIIANPSDIKHIGSKLEAEVLGKSDLELYPKELGEGFYIDDQKVIQTGQPIIEREEYIVDEKGQRIWMLKTKLPLRDENNKIIGLVGIERDVTEKKKAEEERNRAEKEREKLISDLQDALADVKMLSGLMPICASCKKIRDDQGYWTQIESYIQDRSNAKFSHSICPECAKKLYPNYDTDKMIK